MNATDYMNYFEKLSYTRTSGTQEELRCAEFFQSYIAGFGCEAQLQPFAVPMAKIHQAELIVNGKSIPCRGYLCAGNWEVEAPFYYLRSVDPWALSQCKGKIVLVDSYVGFWKYQDIWQSGAVGFISCNGDAGFADRDIDQRELRSYFHTGNRLPGVNIHVKDAIELVRNDAKTAKIILKQEEWIGQSQNVILDLPGEIPEFIALTAHYDTTFLSKGVYDNMSGCLALLSMAEYFAGRSHRYGLRFIWCGSEERGLLGSKYYCSDPENIRDCVMNVNVDLLGCIMGKFQCCVTAEEKLCHYLSCFASETGFSTEVKQDVYSSDSTPFADSGVPAVSMVRLAPKNMATYHNRYDTIEIVSGRQMVEDTAFIRAFVERIANAAICPVSKTIPENVREKLDEYLGKKRLK